MTSAWILGALVVVFVGLTGRLYSLQVVHHEDYLAKRNANSTRSVTLHGTRGGIYTEDGVALAQTTFSGASLVVNPRAVPAARRAELATALANILGRDADYARDLERQLYDRRDRFYYCVVYELPHHLIEQVEQGVRLGELPGVEIRSIETRRYPLGNYASQIVGFVGRDMYGLEGIERALDPWLAATPGRRVTLVDALGRPMEGARPQIEHPKDGAKVELTLNSGIQAIVEDELMTAVNQWDPVGATIIVMETRTGAILGISNYPNYDPNDRSTDMAARRNAALTDAFEPGSTMKPFIYARAFERGLINADSLIEYTTELHLPGRRRPVTDRGNEILPEHRIQMDGKEYVTVRRAIARSSNTVAARVALMLGVDEGFDAVTGIGFARHTGFDLGGRSFGESAGIIRGREHWTEANSLASVSMGYEIQVTAMQMLNSFNAIANHGQVLKPYIVRRVTDQDGELVYEGQPRELLDSWMSPETADALRPLLAEVVNSGTAGNANLPQYQVAGKTGTSLKVKNGQYSRDKICSFVGYAPADDPVISIIVVVNEARAVNYNQWGNRIRHYGGTVAAPTVARVVLRSLKHLGVPEREVEE
jgi:stage V sporulation protein D (sporulation-specific penicillin-binding protein)